MAKRTPGNQKAPAATTAPDTTSANKKSACSLLNILDSGYKWKDKDEVLDAVYWIRQILAVLMGVVWGVLGLTGFLAIVSFILLNSIAAYAIANKTGYDFEPDENFLSVKEGFMTTFASFLVTWTVTYTAYHFGH